MLKAREKRRYLKFWLTFGVVFRAELLELGTGIREGCSCSICLIESSLLALAVWMCSDSDSFPICGCLGLFGLS